MYYNVNCIYWLCVDIKDFVFSFLILVFGHLLCKRHIHTKKCCFLSIKINTLQKGGLWDFGEIFLPNRNIRFWGKKSLLNRLHVFPWVRRGDEVDLCPPRGGQVVEPGRFGGHERGGHKQLQPLQVPGHQGALPALHFGVSQLRETARAHRQQRDFMTNWPCAW